MTPQEAINEVPEQKALALLERLTLRVSAQPSAWVFGWINLEPEEFNERSRE